MIILDTNVLSALMQLRPERRVVEWLDMQPRTSIWVTAVSIFEVRFGLQTMPEGRRRSALMGLFDEILSAKIAKRIAPFDAGAVEQTARLMSIRKQSGRLGEFRDAMIGGIALGSHAQLATRNTKHFDDLAIQLINPWVD